MHKKVIQRKHIAEHGHEEGRVTAEVEENRHKGERRDDGGERVQGQGADEARNDGRHERAA